jgi:hypothetical protein
MLGGSAKRSSIENRGACPRRARDGWVGSSRSVVPRICTLVIDPVLREWWVGKRNGRHTESFNERTGALFYEATEGASERVAARRKRRRVTCRPPCLLKDDVLRLRFASPQNGDLCGSHSSSFLGARHWGTSGEERRD